MRHEEINKIFTDKVSEMIANGYVINSATMSGTQGEIAKVDLVKGDEILRVMLKSEFVYESAESRYLSAYAVFLIVGRNHSRMHKEKDPFDCRQVIWDHDLEILEKRGFYRIKSESGYFTEDIEEIRSMFEVMVSRYRIRESANAKEREVFDLDKARRIVLPFVRRQRGCKTKKETDIKDIRKQFDNGYVVEMTDGKKIALKGRAA